MLLSQINHPHLLSLRQQRWESFAVRHGSAFIDAMDEGGNIALIWAAAWRRDDTLDLLLTVGASIDWKNNIGKTALTTAELFLNLETVELLRQWPEVQRRQQEQKG